MIEIMIKSKERKNKTSWPILRQYIRIFMKGRSNTQAILFSPKQMSRLKSKLVSYVDVFPKAA